MSSITKTGELTPASKTTFPIASPHGEIARIMLAFLTTAGLFYVNIMPALVQGLVEGLGFTNRQAGFVGSANVYGAALGAFAAVFIVKKINWKKVAVGLIIGLVLFDSLSILIRDAGVLIITRFMHGCIGGLLVGIGFAVISRTQSPDRTFGYLLTVQFGLGGLGLMYLPALVPSYGTAALFLALITFSLVTLLMVPFLYHYPVEPSQVDAIRSPNPIRYRLLLQALLATFLFQAANMGAYAYIIGIAQHAGLTMEFTSRTLGQAAWIAILGSILVIVVSTRLGRTWPVFAANLLTVAGTWALHYSELPWVYWLANVGVGITWAFVISYLLGICAEFDRYGQAAALGGFASKMGLASGPFAAALMVGEDNYAILISIASVVLLLSTIIAIRPSLILDRGKF